MNETFKTVTQLENEVKNLKRKLNKTPYTMDFITKIDFTNFRLFCTLCVNSHASHSVF